MSPPARPAISMAIASEWPEPKAWTTPSARSEATMSSAARRTWSSWLRETSRTSSSTRWTYSVAPMSTIGQFLSTRWLSRALIVRSKASLARS